MQQFQSHRKVDRKLQRLSLCPLHPLMHENEKCSVVSDSLQPHRLVHGILGQNTGVGSCSLLQGSSNSGIEPASPALQVDSSPAQLPGKPRTIGVGRPIPSPVDLPNPGIKQGLLCCRQILYQWSHPCIAFAINNIPHQVAHLLDLH